MIGSVLTFEWFLLWLSIVGVAACITTPFILKAVDKSTVRKLNKLGQKEKK
jgi:hypothetical protein